MQSILLNRKMENTFVLLIFVLILSSEVDSYFMSNTVNISQYIYPSMNVQPEYTLFKDKDSVLKFLNDQMSRTNYANQIQNLIDTFENCTSINYSDETESWPFFLIESHNNTIKYEVTKYVEAMMGTVHVTPVVKNMYRYSMVFTAGIMKSAYETLKLYVLNNIIKILMVKRAPVVMNGFWVGRVLAHIKSKGMNSTSAIPPAGSPIFQFPKDLVFPDVLFYLKANKMRNSTFNLEVYKRFKNITVIVIKATGSTNEIVKNIFLKLNETIGHKHSFERQLRNIDIFAKEKVFSLNLYKDEKSLLNYFESIKTNYSNEVAQLFESYKDCFYESSLSVPSGRRKPFIVVDGYNKRATKQIAKMLNGALGGQYLQSPPKCLYKASKLFRNNSELRSNFNALSLYAISFNVKQLLASGVSVVMNGYWYRKRAYILKKISYLTGHLPPSSNPVYEIPKSLIAPDMVFYIRKSRSLNSTNSSKDETIHSLIYRKFYRRRGPFTAMVNSTKKRIAVAVIRRILEIKLRKQFDLSVHIRGLHQQNKSLPYLMFKSEQDILSAIEKEWKYDKGKVDKILEAYNSCFQAKKKHLQVPVQRKPFIAIDGGPRPLRNQIIRGLVKKIDGISIRLPMACMHKLRDFIPSGTILQNCAYGLSVYAAAYRIKQVLARKKAAIITGYWYAAAGHNIGNKYTLKDLPPRGDEIYNPPIDLMMADMFIYLIHVPRPNDPPNPFHMAKLVSIFKNIKDPPVTFIYTNGTAFEIVSNIIRKMREMLGHKLDVRLVPTKQRQFWDLNNMTSAL